MIVQQSIFAVMYQNPSDGVWSCFGVSNTEEDAYDVAAAAVDAIQLSYSFHDQHVQRAVEEVMNSIRIIPAVLGYESWDLNRV